MTREKAITIIKPLMLMMKNPQGEVISDAYYALEMAVQALLQEPCEDAVSRGVFEQVMWERDVAIEQLEELGYSLGEKPKTGHWIDADGNNAICGCCNRLNHLYGKYCKHCGAKMD